MAQGKQTAKDSFVVKAKPNTDVAIKNTFVAQYGRVEVLKGWMVQFIAPASVDPNTVIWSWGEQVLGKGATFDYLENTVGLFWIVMNAKAKGQAVEAGRWVAVGDVTATLSLTIGQQYKKSEDNPNAVLTPGMIKKGNKAITWTGRVSQTDASKKYNPILPDLQWGFIQSATGGYSVFYSADSIKWKEGVPAGTQVTAPKTISTAPKFTNTNDSVKGHQLYSDTAANALGRPGNSWDMPENPDPYSYDVFDNKTNKTTGVGYVVYRTTRPVVFDTTFNLWEVVFNINTGQYVPVAEQQWTLTYNAKDAGPWSAKLVTAEPTYKSFDKLSTAETTTDLNFGDPKSVTSDGAVTFTKK